MENLCSAYFHLMIYCLVICGLFVCMCNLPLFAVGKLSVLKCNHVVFIMSYLIRFLGKLIFLLVKIS